MSASNLEIMQADFANVCYAEIYVFYLQTRVYFLENWSFDIGIAGVESLPGTGACFGKI